jgi:hypothetical protein
MRVLILTCLLFAAACRDEAPPAPTVEEAEQLNEAEQMLNEHANEAGAR